MRSRRCDTVLTWTWSVPAACRGLPPAAKYAASVPDEVRAAPLVVVEDGTQELADVLVDVGVGADDEPGEAELGRGGALAPVAERDERARRCGPLLVGLADAVDVAHRTDTGHGDARALADAGGHGPGRARRRRCRARAR